MTRETSCMCFYEKRDKQWESAAFLYYCLTRRRIVSERHARQLKRDSHLWLFHSTRRLRPKYVYMFCVHYFYNTHTAPDVSCILFSLVIWVLFAYRRLSCNEINLICKMRRIRRVLSLRLERAIIKGVSIEWWEILHFR
jgi:hypothetical protein